MLTQCAAFRGSLFEDSPSTLANEVRVRRIAAAAIIAVVACESPTFAQAEWNQRTPAVSPPQRLAHAMAYDSERGPVVMFGSWLGHSQFFLDTWEWDGETWLALAPAFTTGRT